MSVDVSIIGPSNNSRADGRGLYYNWSWFFSFLVLPGGVVSLLLGHSIFEVK